MQWSKQGTSTCSFRFYMTAQRQVGCPAWLGRITSCSQPGTQVSSVLLLFHPHGYSHLHQPSWLTDHISFLACGRRKGRERNTHTHSHFKGKKQKVQTSFLLTSHCKTLVIQQHLAAQEAAVAVEFGGGESYRQSSGGSVSDRKRDDGWWGIVKSQPRSLVSILTERTLL